MLTVIAAPESLTATIGTAVHDLCGAGLADPAALVDAMPHTARAGLAALGDDDLEAGLIQPLAALGETLSGLVPGHRRIVLIGTTEGLGHWDASLAAGFAAGATGLMRSVALEFMREGVTVNMVALDPTDDRRAMAAAHLAAALLQTDGVSGQVIACDGGNNLRMVQARQRA
ncbi:hypothetical protein C7451_10220 [Blastomonas natatoria]|uniref:Enoyl-ACP reductase-like protein n=1 Tax=Blastomonas natatoria TaxID=34015 RepID=A0A2V3V9V9_9SPHN|nr:short-chain dehydrogenase [Blastomonas natatoria]PXW78350.1 hypothetical protein C7451_10220 [Blastomonas natatoria]